MGLFRAVLLFCCAVIVYFIYEVGWGSDEPQFLAEGETRVFDCYLEAIHRGSVTVTVSDSGRKAKVESLGKQATVVFEGGGLAGDHYRNGDVKLRVDPELNVVGMEGGDRRPCQLEHLRRD
jgi:hypothetical protein